MQARRQKKKKEAKLTWDPQTEEQKNQTPAKKVDPKHMLQNNKQNAGSHVKKKKKKKHKLTWNLQIVEEKSQTLAIELEPKRTL